MSYKIWAIRYSGHSDHETLLFINFVTKPSIFSYQRILVKLSKKNCAMHFAYLLNITCAHACLCWRARVSVCMYLRLCGWWVGACLWMRACMGMCVCVWVCVSVCVCVNVNVFACVNVCQWVCVRMWVRMFVCICIYESVCVWMCAYLYLYVWEKENERICVRVSMGVRWDTCDRVLLRMREFCVTCVLTKYFDV